MFELDDEDAAKKSIGSSSSDLNRLGVPSPQDANLTKAPIGAIECANRKTWSHWKTAKILCRVILFLSVIAIVIGYQKKGILPSAREMVPEMKRAPSQRNTEREPFTFKYRNSSYRVIPKAEYEISGVIVTHNNISGIGDAYHTSDSVDMKDVCVVWGSNVLNDNYRSITYESEPWTCVVNSDDSKVWDRFFMDELSNNHLLAGDEKVQEKIRSVRIGDQIRFTGMLVDYAPAQYPEMLRKSSLVRTDTGNGACEVVFVENFEILKRANSKWYLIYTLGLWGLGVAIGLRLFLFVKAPYGEA